MIAPESANNAKEAGTLVPTLLFGALLGLTIGVLKLGLDLLKARRTGLAALVVGSDTTASFKHADDREQQRVAGRRVVRYLLWIALYLGHMWAFGLAAATAFYLFAFFWLQARTSLVFALAGSVGATLALLVVADVMRLRLPAGLYPLW